MPITIREARAAQADRDWIEDTYGEYLADLTADTTGVFPSLTVTGQSVAEIIQGWFHDDRCTAFIVLREQEPVGFAVVQRSLSGNDEPKRHYRLSEFFIRLPFRNRGVGRGAAMLIFARYAGEWTVPEQSKNPRAIRFWRRVVNEFTNGKYREKRGQGEVGAFVHERRTGERSGALTNQSLRTVTRTFRGPDTSNSISISNVFPSTNGFFSPISITCMPFGANSSVWPASTCSTATSRMRAMPSRISVRCTCTLDAIGEEIFSRRSDLPVSFFSVK